MYARFEVTILKVTWTKQFSGSRHRLLGNRFVTKRQKEQNNTAFPAKQRVDTGFSNAVQPTKNRLLTPFPLSAGKAAHL